MTNEIHPSFCCLSTYVRVVLLNLKRSKSNQVHHSSLTTSSLPSDSLTLLLAPQAPQE